MCQHATLQQALLTSPSGCYQDSSPCMLVQVKWLWYTLEACEVGCYKGAYLLLPHLAGM